MPKERSPSTPRHIAVIMDGNGRWAERRGLKRSDGHRAGTETIHRLLDYLIKIRIPYVSLYAFSTENWKRPQSEITTIFQILNDFIQTRLEEMVVKGVRIVVSGDVARLPQKTRDLVGEAIKKTARGKKLTANFCLNYGARDEILRAAAHWAKTRKAGAGKKIPTEKELRRGFWQPQLPDIDLLVRTAGEMRLSNFMLWQAAYAELYFTEKTWPEFAAEDVDAAIAEYGRRKRKFGGP